MYQALIPVSVSYRVESSYVSLKNVNYAARADLDDSICSDTLLPSSHFHWRTRTGRWLVFCLFNKRCCYLLDTCHPPRAGLELHRHSSYTWHSATGKRSSCYSHFTDKKTDAGRGGGTFSAHQYNHKKTKDCPAFCYLVILRFPRSFDRIFTGPSPDSYNRVAYTLF